MNGLFDFAWMDGGVVIVAGQHAEGHGFESPRAQECIVKPIISPRGTDIRLYY